VPQASLLSNRHRRSGSSGSCDDDLYVFEEASQSSFGETSTRSEVARARNGILPADPRHPLAKDLANIADRAVDDDGLEEHFVFGRNGEFTDGGFIISAAGLLQTPERKVRVVEHGDGSDGPRSTNFILVRSMDEFKAGPSLGSGAAAHVYLASHAQTHAKMAVKVINVYDEGKRNQFLKELETLISHNNRYLVRSYGAFYDGAGFVHVTLEYMDRGALSDVVRKTGQIPEPIIRHIARSCLHGLSYLHKNRILHRDFKSANILLSRRAGLAKLSDFGLARDLIPGTSIADTFVGTLAYMSPERLHGIDYTYASDVWGLGISLLECALGKYPFEKPQCYFDYVAAVRANPWELMSDFASPEMLSFVQQCTKLEPSERANVEALLIHPWMHAKLNDDGVDTVSQAERDRLLFCSWLDRIPDVGVAATAAAATTPDHVSSDASSLSRPRVEGQRGAVSTGGFGVLSSSTTRAGSYLTSGNAVTVLASPGAVPHAVCD
jgi:serine/threonine protein kinase